MTLLVAIVLLTSELPDPGKLCTVTFASAFGGFLGGAIGRARSGSRDRVKDLTVDGAFVGFALGFAGWLIAFAIHRL